MQCQNIKAESFYIWNLKLIKGKDEGGGGIYSLNPWVLEQNTDFRTNKLSFFSTVDNYAWDLLSPYVV